MVRGRTERWSCECLSSQERCLQNVKCLWQNCVPGKHSALDCGSQPWGTAGAGSSPVGHSPHLDGSCAQRSLVGDLAARRHSGERLSWDFFSLCFLFLHIFCKIKFYDSHLKYFNTRATLIDHEETYS